MKQDTVTIYMKRKDAGFVAEAIKHYQKEKGINVYEIKYGINGLRMFFGEIDKDYQQEIKTKQK